MKHSNLPAKEITKNKQDAENMDPSIFPWRALYKTGGLAALMAGIFFRRNLAAEISFFFTQEQPETVTDWFVLLQNNRLMGLSSLNIFDLVNYMLIGLMFLALYVLLRQFNQSYMAIATALGFSGIIVFFASNTAFSMLSLSNQYATAASETQRSMLQAAGQALLAMNRFSAPDAGPGSGGYLSLLLIAFACLVICIVMLRSNLFNRLTACAGIFASVLDLAYCTAFLFTPSIHYKTLALCFMPAAGLFWMIWHILTGQRLYKLGKS